MHQTPRSTFRRTPTRSNCASQLMLMLQSAIYSSCSCHVKKATIQAVPQYKQYFTPAVTSKDGGQHATMQQTHRQTAPATTPPNPPAAVAIDLEYIHMMLDDGCEVSAPAWVALVDQHCNLLLKTYINPQVPDSARCFGGVPHSACAAAPTLPEVLQQLQALTAGKLLLGHGLAKDLAALGLRQPEELVYDTMTHQAFCNKAGNSRSLKQLAKAFLNITIQEQPRPVQKQAKRHQRQHQRQRQQQQQQRLLHDPQEDATAVMQLYQKFVVPSTYEGQVAAATQQLLLQIQQRQQQLQQDAKLE